MGANFVFSEMLPTHPSQANGQPGARRQLEIFSHGGTVWLRVGPVDQENASTERYTVELPPAALELLQQQLALLMP
jgi:hypothetical protein